MKCLTRVSVFAALIAVLVITGCDSFSEKRPEAGSSSVAARSASDSASDFPQDQRLQTFDEQMASVAQNQLPGFGGFFYDRDGQANIYLKRGSFAKSQALNTLASAPAASQSVLSEIQSAISKGKVNVIEGSYSFGALNSWKQQLGKDFMGYDEIVSLDIRESENRLHVGIKNIDMAKRFEREFEAAGIPAEAVTFKEERPAVNFVSLSDKIRPTVGGLLIQNESGNGCTLGFNVMLGGEGSSRFEYDTPGFITNAHCAPPLGQVNGTNFYQPGSSGSYVGEVVRTITQSANCPPGKTCYRADAVGVAYADGIAREPAIARPERKWDTRGLSYRRRIDSQNPRFPIESTYGSSFEGYHLHKVGATTGWTDGYVSETCKDITTNGGSVIKLCQNVVQKPSSAPSNLRIAYYGDSGSPVFDLEDDEENGNDAPILRGLLWGGDPMTGDTFYFSPLRLINGLGNSFLFRVDTQ